MNNSSLSHSISKAYLWTTVGNLSRNVAGFAISLVLAHLLGPKEYGLLSMAMVFTAILSMLQDCGIGQAVVYHQEERAALPLYFTAAAAIGAVLSLVAFLLAPVFAAYYRQPAVTPIVRALSPTLLFGSVYSVAQGALTREFNFRAIAIIELLGTAVAGVVGIVCALLGWGVWALVINVVLSSSIQAAGVCCLVRPRFTAHLDMPKLRKILRWGLPLTGASFLWQGYENADYMVVGRFLGQEALGYYGFAFRIATMVNSRLASIITRVTFPEFSAVQKTRSELVEHWSAITERLGLIVFPMSVMMAVDAHDFLLVAVGPKWLPAELPLQLLCIMAGLKCLSSIMTNCMHAIGHTQLSFQYNLANAILLPLSFIAGCKLAGIAGVAAAWSVVAPLITAVFLVKTLRLVEGSVRRYAARLVPGILIAAACAAAMGLAGLPLGEGIQRLVLRTAAGALITLAGYWAHKPTRALILGYLPARRVAV